jgi:hypothetical protein
VYDVIPARVKEEAKLVQVKQEAMEVIPEQVVDSMEVIPARVVVPAEVIPARVAEPMEVIESPVVKTEPLTEMAETHVFTEPFPVAQVARPMIKLNASAVNLLYQVCKEEEGMPTLPKTLPEKIDTLRGILEKIPTEKVNKKKKITSRFKWRLIYSEARPRVILINNFVFQRSDLMHGVSLCDCRENWELICKKRLYIHKRYEFSTEQARYAMLLTETSRSTTRKDIAKFRTNSFQSYRG